MKTSLIIVGAGNGSRFGQPKAEGQLAGKSLLDHVLRTVQKLEFLDEIGLVVQKEQIEKYEGSKFKVVEGGETRMESVWAGLQVTQAELVLIHNVANPLASEEDFRAVYQALLKQRCAVFVGQPVVDTIRRVNEKSSETLSREDLWRVQTPQGFYRAELTEKIEQSGDQERTDEVQLFEGTETPVLAIKCSPMNIKVTYPEDLEMLDQYLGNEVRVGIGEDSHAFDVSGTLILGGVEVAGYPKLKANSDGDVILHALFNAISSALGKGSIGLTADEMCAAGIGDSGEYLKVILKQMRSEGYTIQQLSLSLTGEQPKIDPLSTRIKEHLAEILRIQKDNIGITAHTGESISFSKNGLICRILLKITKTKTNC